MPPVTQVSEIQWSTQETEIAKAALQTAHQREVITLVEMVRDQMVNIQDINDLWQLHDFLSARRFDLDGKYDDRESEILFVLSKLLKEGWIAMDDLAGLAATKLSKISALTRIL
jgi:hypothetical protein